MSDARYVLDTDIVSDLARNPAGRVARRIAEVGAAGLAIGVVSVAELRFGLAKRGSPRLSRQVAAVLEGLEILALGPPVDVEYGDIRLHLEQAGAPIGPNDLLIAAHARSIGATLVTDNIREFSRVPRLKVENWLDLERDEPRVD